MPFLVLIVLIIGRSSCEDDTKGGNESTEDTSVTIETNTDSNSNDTDDENMTSVFKNLNFTTYFNSFEVTKIQMQVRSVIKSFEEYRAEIALGSALLVASVFAISIILSGVYFNRLKKNRKEMKDLNKQKNSITFPRDTDMEVNAVLSIYRAKKIEIQAVNNGKATTHRYDEGTDNDDEVIYYHAGKSKIIDFEVVNPVYFVDGVSYEAKLEEKQKN